MSLLFGPAGIPLSAKERSTEGGIREVANLDLGCMEIEFVRGVKMGRDKAATVKEVARKYGIVLTVHAPYFINLNSSEKEKREASKKRILDSARIGYLAGAKSVTFHAAYYGADNPDRVYARIRESLEEIVYTLRNGGIRLDIRPETTGKISQFGTLDEVLSLSKEIPGVKPCIDFAHIYARSGGKFNSYKEFTQMLNKVKGALDGDGLKDLHIHVSGIEYGPKGEKNHLPLERSDFRYKELLRSLKTMGAQGIVISESPILEQDALLMKQIYEGQV